MILSKWEEVKIKNNQDSYSIFRRFIFISKFNYKSSAIIIYKDYINWNYKIRFISNYKEEDFVVRDLSECDSWSIGLAETREVAMLYADLMAIEMGYDIESPLVGHGA